MKARRTQLKRGNTVQYRVDGDAGESVADELVRQVWASLGHPNRRCSVAVERDGNGWVVTVTRSTHAKLDMTSEREALEQRLERLDRRGRDG